MSNKELFWVFFYASRQTHKAGRPLQGVGYNYFIPEAESTTSPSLCSKCHQEPDSNPHSADQTPELESGATARPRHAVNSIKHWEKLLPLK